MPKPCSSWSTNKQSTYILQSCSICVLCHRICISVTIWTYCMVCLLIVHFSTLLKIFGCDLTIRRVWYQTDCHVEWAARNCFQSKKCASNKFACPIGWHIYSWINSIITTICFQLFFKSRKYVVEFWVFLSLNSLLLQLEGEEDLFGLAINHNTYVLKILYIYI